MGILLYILFACLLSAPPQQMQLKGTVVNVHDGDTFTMLADCERMVTVRLAAIDCPELDQPYGASARRLVKKLAYGKQITVDSTGRDKYGRVLGFAILPDGDTLNHQLLRNGLAWQYTKYDSSEYLHRLESSAKEKKYGLWKKLPTPPWEHRHQ